MASYVSMAVPQPQKGSSTISPSLVESLITRSRSAMGFLVDWKMSRCAWKKQDEGHWPRRQDRPDMTKDEIMSYPTICATHGMRWWLLCASLAALAASSTAAGESEWEYLDITVELVDEERQPHPIDEEEDILTLELAVTNNGKRTVDGVDGYLWMGVVIVDGLDDTHYGRSYWTGGPLAPFCPEHLEDVRPGQTETWYACFVVPKGLPTGEEPDLLRIYSYPPDPAPSGAHVVQFHSYSAPCHETDGSFCAPYTLDGRLTPEDWMAGCQMAHDGSLRSAERLINCWRNLAEDAVQYIMLLEEGWDGLYEWTTQPRITIEETKIVSNFYDSKGNSYTWSLPVEAYEDSIQISREKSENLWRHPLRLNNDGATLISLRLDGFVRGNFGNVIDRVYDNSDGNADFIREVWYIVSQLTVYEEDVYPHSEGRYANETLSRGGGDCEDLVILIADMLVSSEHTRDWIVQYIYMDGDNPRNPQEVNHIALYVHDGERPYYIEATGPPAWDYYPDGVWGWYFDVWDGQS